ncbi:sensor histidine kinase [Pedobacter yulinensis]|uniref:Sensor histidine kinase n=1 Tax=Pedobacter yulinensis TaxID=2126353 RepID=A0A2T3HIA4_9SPHI|nr:histidine kinase [Pedobacter yulinensis]PST82160.1 sensor histidine kinase [Pedobacter yulinensis]
MLVWTAACIAFLYYELDFQLEVAVADSLISNVLLSVACISVSNLLGYYQPKNERILFTLAATALLTAIVVYVSKLSLCALFSNDRAYGAFFGLTLYVRAALMFLWIAWCALANVLWYRLDEQSAMQERLLQAQSLAKEAELNKLRHQLQPHFLFNSLNSVFALTMVNPKEAGVMITKLASFLRGTLKRDDEIWVELAEEIEYIQLYLDIEKVRFSHRLQVEVAVEEAALVRALPGTLLQPIVENAIKFGLYNTSTAITIRIEAKAMAGMLEISVSNPFDPQMKAAGGTGFGLGSIRRRLYLLFADSSLLQTRVVDDNLYITTLKIPQKNDSHHTH